MTLAITGCITHFSRCGGFSLRRGFGFGIAIAAVVAVPLLHVIAIVTTPSLQSIFREMCSRLTTALCHI